jgi:putative ABC transport system ATP-binding protein
VPNLTILENLTLAYLRGTRKGLKFAINRKNEDFFKDKLSVLNLGLENKLKTKMGLLSGGQRQAVTLLMATLGEPKLLLLDEHTAALDPKSCEKVLEITKSIVSERKITTIMITHNMKIAGEIGSRKIRLGVNEVAFGG